MQELTCFKTFYINTLSVLYIFLEVVRKRGAIALLNIPLLAIDL